MNTQMMTNRRSQCIAGAVAALATLLTLGGTLTLAMHYAQTGAGCDASGYYAEKQARRIDCADNGSIRTAVVSPRRDAENSWRGLAPRARQYRIARANAGLWELE